MTMKKMTAHHAMICLLYAQEKKGGVSNVVKNIN